MSNGTLYTHTVQRSVKWLSAMSNSTAHIPNGVALLEMAQGNVEQHSVRTNGVALREMAQRNVEWYSVHTNSVALREMAQRNVEW